MADGAIGTFRDARWRGFARTLGLAAAGSLALGAGLVVLVDPLWIYRAEPPWLRWTGGVNRLLDSDMRRAKPLQLFVRPARTVLIGSSVVYRGLDADGLAGGSYNFGISSLMADELPRVARLVAGRPGVERVVLGLDSYMFTTLPVPTRLASGLEEAGARRLAALRTAFSLRTLAGSMPFVIGRAHEGGAWRVDGFKATPDYGPDATRRIAAAQDFAVQAYRPELVGFLDEALSILRGLDVRLYLSPVSASQRALAAQAGRTAAIDRWRADMAAVAARHGRALRDLTSAHPFDDFDPERGSSPSWFDNVHFKPVVGRWVMAEIGLVAPARRAEPPAPETGGR